MTYPLALLAALVPADLLLVQPPAKPAAKKVALLIGVNEYTKRGLTDLKFAEPDVVALSAALTDAGFAVKAIRGAEGIGDKKSGREVYFSALNDVLRGVGKADTVVLAFSGHGVQLEVNGKESPYFCPADAVPTDPTTLIPLNEVLKVLDVNGGGYNLVLVDACRNFVDPDRGKRGGINGRRIDNLPEGTAVFFSCGGRQVARETDKMFPAGGGNKGHGVFFHFVLEGLRGAKDSIDEDGRVTWDRLVPFVKERVRKANAEWFPDVPADQRQVPHAIGSLGEVPPLLDADVVFHALLARTLGVKGRAADGKGLVLTAVLPGGAGARLGWKPQSVLTKIDDKELGSEKQIRRAVFDFAPDGKHTFEMELTEKGELRKMQFTVSDWSKFLK